MCLAGRETERARLAALIDEAWASRGGAIVVRGLPGVGKSALLADLADAEGMQVLRTQGIESESPLPFAALHRLLRPVRHHVERLPEPQGRALRAAFGEEEGDGGDRFRVFLATLSLLAETAEQGPVLALVDDAHWLDEASAAALLFVARRLQAERVAMVFAARDGDVRGFDSGDLPEMVLRDLDGAAATTLLTRRAGVPVPAEVRDRLMSGTGGNPLALVELAAALPVEQLSGAAPLPRQLPLTEGVERAFLDRYRRLSAQAQAVMRVAAADDSGRVRAVQQAAAMLGAESEALHAVERSGLLRVRDGAIELRHPLVRSAVYGAATTVERREAHRALAAVLTSPGDADRRAWHRAAAAAEPDEAVVAELDAAADRAYGRGGLEAASAAWERAAELTASEQPRTQRLYAAARAAWLAGEPVRARRLADGAMAGIADPGLHADIARLRARIEWNAGSSQLGHRLVLEAAAAVAGHDPDRAREMAMFAAAIESFGGDSGVDVDPLRMAAPETASSVRTRAFADLLVGLHHAARADWSLAAPPLREALQLTRNLDEENQDLLPNLGIAALHYGDDAAALRSHELIVSRARRTGAIVMVLYGLTRRGFTDISTGRWGAGSAGASEALQLAGGTGQPGLGALPLTWLALLAGLRGEPSAPSRLAEAEEVSAAHPTGILANVIADLLRWARGIEAMSDPLAALHHVEQMSNGLTRRMAGVDRIEIATRAGRTDLADLWIAELDEFALATKLPWGAALAAHGRAVRAGEDAEEHFVAALAQHQTSPRIFDRARTELAYGEHLRRARRRVDARPHLRAALETFEDLGASRWAARASAELRASGQTARKRDVAAATALTAQELHVARLVAQGMSNRDVAAELFLSPRTIDFHLRNVFAKVGVTSRTELAHVPLDT